MGVSSGAALGAAIAIVGGSAFGGLPESFGPYLLSVRFSVGSGWIALVYRLAGATPDQRRDDAVGRSH